MPRLDPQSRTTRAALNMVTQTGMTAATMAVSLFSVPFLLKFLGRERFGEWRVITDCFGYLTLIELGLGASLLALLTKAIATNDSTLQHKLLGTTWNIYLRITLCMLITGLCLSLFLPIIINPKQTSKLELWLTGFITVLTVISTPINVGRVLRSVRQQDYLTNSILTSQLLFTTSLMLLFALMGCQLPGQALALVLGQIPMTLFLIRTLYKECPQFWCLASDPAATQALWNLNWPTFLIDLSGRIGFFSDNVIVSWIAGPLAVVPFFLTQRLVIIVQVQLQGIGNAVWSGLIELHHRGDRALFKERTIELTTLISGMGFAILIPLGFFNGDFITLWVGPLAYGGRMLTSLACINAWLLSLFSFWGWLIVSSGGVARSVPYSLLFSTINLLVSVGATFFYHLEGPLIGTLAAFLLINSWSTPKILNDLFGLTWTKLWYAALQPMFWGLPFAVICLGVAHLVAYLKPPGWLGLMGEVGLTSIIGLGLMWTFSLGVTNRLEWARRFQQLLTSITFR